MCPAKPVNGSVAQVDTVIIGAKLTLNTPIPWTPLVTTNVPAMPFDYVDFDVKLSDKPQKYYRVRQP